MALCRFSIEETSADGQWGWLKESRIYPLATETVREALKHPGAEGLRTLERSALQNVTEHFSLEAGAGSARLLAPILPTQEVWAAGVTYESSKFARMSESESASDLYAKVYTADRPELFFKATPSRVIGPGGGVRIRSDSHWNVPEPELAALVGANGAILGYTIGNDMSSRDIEGENTLYLPQAKVYRACCGLGPYVVPADTIDAQTLAIGLTIARDGQTVFAGETNTSRMRRTVADIVDWLFREDDFPHGVFVLTGTGIVPSDSFTLRSGDSITIEIEKVGSLRNVVA